ncbi:MAG TPA: hypothetical protein VE684_05790 [Crenalkalicoccus sp.]|nr:hypothetical protein [Crenalkalicoccus sp.]
MSDAVMKSLGQLNEGWGICGFTSTFYAMYQANPGSRGWLVNATQVYSVLYEISDYLKALQAAQSPMLQDITAFTRSFGDPYDTFTVEDYIQRIDTLSENTRQYLAFGNDALTRAHETGLKDYPLFGIAMPPQAVADYIERMWKWRATVAEFNAAGFSGDAIVGVRNVKNTTMKMYHGLCHYLFRGGSTYYSWGRTFASLTDANADYAICYAITVRKY